MNSENLLTFLSDHGLGEWAEHLRAPSSGWLVGHGDYPRWQAAVAALPELEDIEAQFDLPAVTIRARNADTGRLREALRGLMPWRKGPFRIAEVFIDCEWRSDFKWQRVAPHLAPLDGRRILDVGCGNGYYGWRMLAANPELVLGIEPSVLFNLQFQALQRYLERSDIDAIADRGGGPAGRAGVVRHRVLDGRALPPQKPDRSPGTSCATCCVPGRGALSRNPGNRGW